jgi:hypothetical protein
VASPVRTGFPRDSPFLLWGDANRNPGGQAEVGVRFLKRNMAALVVGNGAYRQCNPLANPVNDAEDMTAKLTSYGFRVVVATDATRAEMDRKLREFKVMLETNEVGLFFFAGHGIQIDGTNYLLAVNTDMASEIDAKHSSLSLDKVIDTMAKSNALTKIVILDACRNNPWKRAWQRDAATRGLASVYAPKGTIIGFATSPGELADDGLGRNGTYTAALLQHIDTPDCSIETMFKRVRNMVAAATDGDQTSWEHTSLSGDFYFNMSLGKIIHDYHATSLADEQFAIDLTQRSHKIINGLKSRDWYKQNDALALLGAESAKKMAKDNLFVIGRNIYQAACGNAHGAQDFLENFVTVTRPFETDDRKAILDGLLFEIFFDHRGELREKIKGRYFNEVFALQRHAELKESFKFIAEALGATRGDFYSLPGKNHQLAVTVKTKKIKGYHRVEEVFVNGANVLRAEEEEGDVLAADERLHHHMDLASLNKRLSEELIVPSQLLNVTYTPALDDDPELAFPVGYTVRKG